MLGTDIELKQLLESTRTIAVVGISPKPERASHEVALYLQHHGYTIIPVNPVCDEVLGLKCYPSLREVPVKIDVVDVFRRSEEVMPVVEDAIAIGARAVWLQLDVIAPEAIARAEAAGLSTVMDRCTKIEHRRLLTGG
ncbi:CoA-binding protein [Parazoarcus communis]|uniref:CoA-binding protein n=1 Tax=Parazoarcus communis TaxID=41977 RepID=A0A2U8GQQ5_9RHOO|nr:CoA-binding protein [Parazoarcus communis]AWI76029.1 CoA-binding protein [Parazoarcus communis]